jgi:hypothetical protein
MITSHHSHTSSTPFCSAILRRRSVGVRHGIPAKDWGRQGACVLRGVDRQGVQALAKVGLFSCCFCCHHQRFWLVLPSTTDHDTLRTASLFHMLCLMVMGSGQTVPSLCWDLHCVTLYACSMLMAGTHLLYRHSAGVHVRCTLACSMFEVHWLDVTLLCTCCRHFTGEPTRQARTARPCWRRRRPCWRRRMRTH